MHERQSGTVPGWLPDDELTREWIGYMDQQTCTVEETFARDLESHHRPCQGRPITYSEVEITIDPWDNVAYAISFGYDRPREVVQFQG